MLIKYDNIIYDIEKLAKNSEYFSIIKSSNYSENVIGCIDMTHRGYIMKYVLDMLSGNNFNFELSSTILIEMKPILDELLVSENYLWKFDYDNCWNVISSAIQKERKEARIKIAQDKEGYRCNKCFGINKWYASDDDNKLDWWTYDAIFCDCNYIRDAFGDRESPQEEDL